MKNKSLLLLLLYCGIFSGYAQLRSVSPEQIDSLQTMEQRNVVIFIHTDWCSFCHAMKNNTLKNKTIIEKLNSAFYYIDFDAEEHRTVIFNKTIFQFNATGNKTGTHELAMALGTIDKQLNFPTLCILNHKNEIIFQHSGYIKPKEFKLILAKLKE